MSEMVDIEVEWDLIEAAIAYCGPVLAKSSGRNVEWVKRRMREEVEQIIAGRRPFGELGCVALGMAFEAGLQTGRASQTEVETGAVVNFVPRSA